MMGSCSGLIFGGVPPPCGLRVTDFVVRNRFFKRLTVASPTPNRSASSTVVSLRFRQVSMIRWRRYSDRAAPILCLDHCRSISSTFGSTRPKGALVRPNFEIQSDRMPQGGAKRG